jgi:hypothetical protein
MTFPALTEICVEARVVSLTGVAQQTVEGVCRCSMRRSESLKTLGFKEAIQGGWLLPLIRGLGREGLDPQTVRPA